MPSTDCQVDEFSPELHRRSSYRPLSPGHIRVIVLQPGGPDDALLADLQTRALAAGKFPNFNSSAALNPIAEPGYEAISYCWGDLHRSRHLHTLDGPAIPITESLYAALQSFRYEDRPRHLWADAASINQEDIDERSSQVAIMGDIYAQADRVLVWLGPSSEDADTLAFTALSMPIAAKGSRSRRELLALLEDHLRHTTSCTCCGSSVINIKPPSIEDSLIAVAKLLERPWFGRLWVVQEVALARTVEVYCGIHHADWTVFTELARVPGQYEVDSDYHDSSLPDTLPRAALRQVWARMNYLNQLRARNRARQALKDPFRPTLICKDLLMLSHLQCRDPRDRIYGVSRVLGLEGFMSLRPDYGISVAELYRRVAELFLTAAANRGGGKAVVMLALAGTESRTGESLPRPSWVPDLQRLSDRSRSKYTLYQWAFAARRSFGNSLNFRCKASSTQPEDLIIRGRCFGSVETVLDLSACPSKHVHRRSHSKCPVDEGVSLLLWYRRCCEFLSQSLISVHPRPSKPDGLESQTIIRELFASGASSQAAEESPQIDLDILQTWLVTTPQADSKSTINNIAQDLRPYITGYPHDRDRNLCIFKTDFGNRAGWIPPTGRPGDDIWYFAGAPYPFLLRPDMDAGFKLLGDTFVQGIAETEILDLDRVRWLGLLHNIDKADSELKTWVESSHRAKLKELSNAASLQELRSSDRKMKEKLRSLTQQVQRMIADADGLLGWVRLR